MFVSSVRMYIRTYTVACKGPFLLLPLQRFTYDYRCLKGEVEQHGARNGKEGEVSIEMERPVASPSGATSPEMQQMKRRIEGRGLRLPVALAVVSCGCMKDSCCVWYSRIAIVAKR